MHTLRLNIMEQGRATEWLASLVLLNLALILAWPGETTTSTSGFRTFVELGLDDAALAAPLGFFSTLRMAALYVNGNWLRSPAVRMVGSVVGASVFAMVGMAFLWPAIEHGSAVSTGVAVYFTLAVFDALSAYRSGADVRMVHQLSKRT